MERQVHISSAHWRATWQGLKLRGGGRREAACVWGGRRFHDREVVGGVYFIDDLPGVESHRDYHRTSRQATIELFEALRSNGHVITADVHTHPRGWVGLSLTDAAHPIEYRPGLLAIILPFYARKKPDLLSSGVHEYLGNGRWKEVIGAEAKLRIIIQA